MSTSIPLTCCEGARNIGVDSQSTNVPTKPPLAGDGGRRDEPGAALGGGLTPQKRTFCPYFTRTPPEA